MPGYNPQAIEKKWQDRWAAAKTFATNATDTSKPKYYVLDMFPYPSGSGLHVGHPEGYTATDIVARYKRAKGFNVMHPMGWDAFGLPAEQYAIKNNVHPRETTANNINRFRKQLQALGFSYDWDREVDTTDPNYYRWTQWIFLKLYDTWFDEKQQKGRPISELIAEFQSGTRPIPPIPHYQLPITTWAALTPTAQRQVLAYYRLAYEAEVPVNWCPGLGTVLANEEVIDGKSEVGGFPVERRPMKQWMLRITAYSERLIAGLEKLEWSDSLKEMQRNWIGKSEGAVVYFDLDGSAWGDRPGLKLNYLHVFTTRPDTLFGATYMVLAPEHWTARIDPRDVQDPETKPHFTIVPEQWPEGTREEWKQGEASPRSAVKKYQQWAATRSDRERQEDTQKTGAFTGMFAINPVNGGRIPVFISDYVLMNYGTGAIMAVPAHDERDHEFATKFRLPIVQVVAPLQKPTLAPHGNAGPSAAPAKAVSVQEKPFTEEGIAINSPWVDGLPTPEAKSKIITMLEEKRIGKREINYKIRDWLFSRQRYWGEPFPLIHLEDGTTVPLTDSELPVRLPELEDFKPTGTIDPPLSKAAAWKDVWVTLDAAGTARVVPAGTPNALKARRELNTMPQWAGSCWYYIRYTDSKNSAAFVDRGVEKYWLNNGVDLYVGGVEHAVLHLLYSRFWHKVLFDWNLVSNDEPFRKLVNQGLILGEVEYTVFKTDFLSDDGKGGQIQTSEYVSLENVAPDLMVVPDQNGMLQTVSKDMTTGHSVFAHRISETEVEKRGDVFVLRSNTKIRVDARSYKMSKSRGNVVNPDDVIAEYGADALRLFEMFMGPLEQVKPWSTAGVEGVYRFLQRVWRNLFDENDAPKVIDAPGDDALTRALHKLIKRVGDEVERLSFNTSIAGMMEFNNLMAKSPAISRDTAISFLRLLEPFAPHFAEEAYERLAQSPAPHGNAGPAASISHVPWPTYDPALLVDATVEIPVQVNGKLRSRIQVSNDADEATVLAAALADPEVQKSLAGKEPKKKIYVKGRMVNLVV